MKKSWVIQESILQTQPKLRPSLPSPAHRPSWSQVFVDALPHLPSHRRETLFAQLATTIGAEQHLWILLALICNAHVTRGAVLEAGDDDAKHKAPR